jgi:hypothetical protein
VGRGNQRDDLEATNFNSYFRMAAMRDTRCWQLAAEVLPIARQHPDALTHAKAGLAKAGNCGEYASVAMDFLRVNASGEELHYSVKDGLDHAFVIVGPLRDANVPDHDLAVADAWPMKPTACLWDDFFAYTSWRGNVKSVRTQQGGGEDYASIIAGGLSLSAFGRSQIERRYTDKETRKGIKDARERGWMWNHQETARTHYEYVGPDEEEIQEQDPALPDLDLPSSTQDDGDQSDLAPELRDDPHFRSFIRWIGETLS